MTNPYTPLRRVLFGLLAAAACLVGTAAAAQPIRFAGLRSGVLLPLLHAQEQGYFKAENIEVELIPLNSGPAAVSALVSGSAEIANFALMAAMFARTQNQPIQVFAGLTYETADPNGQWIWLQAAERSAIRSMKDLAGKTVALNTFGAACELMLRDHLARAGVPFDAVKKIVVPFPQMPAALQLGNADAVCNIEPFRTNAEVSPAIRATTLAGGVLADRSQRYVLDVLAVREDWGAANKDKLRRFNRALQRAFADYQRDPTLLRRQYASEFKLNPATVSLMKANLNFKELSVDAAMVRPIAEALVRNGMLPRAPSPAELLLDLR